MKLLLHSCCAPCTVGTMEILKKENLEPTIYWYNPNIHPLQEYIARMNCLEEYCDKENLRLIVENEYSLDDFCKSVSGNLKNRCNEYCYPLRLRKTFQYAKENGYDTVSTTLLYSIYQKHDYIKKLCEEYSKEYGLDFLYKDFRIEFWEGYKKAKELELYMQKYCGCVFSEAQTILAHKNEKPKLPEGFEFLPVKRDIIIKKDRENKEKYIDLLLQADPSREQIEKYLESSDLFVLTYKDDVANVAVVQIIDDDTIELKNIATKEKYRGQGYAKKMLKYLADNYKQKYKRMLVGTTENNIPFYVKQGFDKYEKTIKNYFIDNYDEEIIDGDLHCIDMYYYSKDL